LIVDDNRELAENLGEILETEGHEPVVVTDPLKALELARGSSFDAAILDVRMPVMDGIELHRRLFELMPCTVFMLMTAYTRDERIDEALAAGVETVLTKPLDIEAALQTIREGRAR
jgi:CheY-like chemotaxis protein